MLSSHLPPICPVSNGLCKYDECVEQTRDYASNVVGGILPITAACKQDIVLGGADEKLSQRALAGDQLIWQVSCYCLW